MLGAAADTSSSAQARSPVSSPDQTGSLVRFGEIFHMPKPIGALRYYADFIEWERAPGINQGMRTGMVSINGRSQSFDPPRNAFKQSGMGRDTEPEGFQAYLESKSYAI